MDVDIDMCKKLAVPAFLLLLIAVITTSTAAQICTIHGTLYEWSTFEPLKNVIITVNTTPPQEFVAKKRHLQLQPHTGSIFN